MIRHEIPDGAEAHSPKVIDALISQYSRCGEIEAVGRRKATRRSRHANANCVWRRNPTTPTCSPAS